MSADGKERVEDVAAAAREHGLSEPCVTAEPEEATEEKPDGSDLTTGCIKGHLRRLAVPASVGFFFNVLFNVTDTLCAGFWSNDAQASLAFTFPLFFIVISCSVGLSQATSGLVSRALGGGHVDRARYYIGQAVVMAGIVGALIAVLGNLVARPMLEFLGSTPEQTDLGMDYIVLIFAFAFLFQCQMVLSGVLSSHGNTHTFRNCLMAASVLNVLLDPMFMFGWFGLPALGMQGIAIATVLAQVLMVGWMLPVALRLRASRGLKPLHLSPRLKAQGTIAGQMVPPTLNMAAINVGFIVNTYFLALEDTLAVAAYGIALRIEQLVLLLTIGLNIGLLTIAGQNFGARNYDRVREVFSKATRYGLVIVAGGAALLLVAGRLLIELFNRDETIIGYGYEYLVVAAVLGPFYIYAHNSTAMLQAIGKPAMLGPMGAVRLIILPPILCWLFVINLGYGTKGVWLSLLIANVFTTVFIVAYTRWTLRKVAPLPGA